MSSPFSSPFSSILGDQNIIIPAATTASLLIPSPTINSNYLFPPPPLSPATSESSIGSSSPVCSDSEDFSVPMDQLINVKRLLKMFPPPMTAKQFIFKNSFRASDGHIKRPSNNFILFRKIAHDQKNQTTELSMYNEREFSKIIGKIWDGLTADEKSTYKMLGKEVADIHKEMFPEYKYQPKRDKAAWKHFNPENNNNNLKPKRKNKVKQQKQQETTIPEVPRIDIPQQEQIITENTLDYSLPVEDLDPMNYYPYPTNNNTFTSNSYGFDDNLLHDYSALWSLNNVI